MGTSRSMHGAWRAAESRDTLSPLPNHGTVREAGARTEGIRHQKTLSIEWNMQTDSPAAFSREELQNFPELADAFDGGPDIDDVDDGFQTFGQETMLEGDDASSEASFPDTPGLMTPVSPGRSPTATPPGNETIGRTDTYNGTI